ncbi:MAG: YpdA family putative bacillithiol disulfide reductase [Bacteroidota bacterium]
MNTLDVIIIGAGPSGINVGIACQQQNRSHLILEKGVLINSLYHFPTNMTFFSTSKKLEIGDVPFVSHSEKPTRKEALEYYRRVVERWNLNVKLYEAVQKMHHEDGLYHIKTSKDIHASRAVVVATGFYDIPNPLNVKGEDLPKVKHYYNDPHPYVGQEVLVVGAANSAVDVALETWRVGAKVTMVIRGEEISPRVKYWIRPNIVNRIKEGSIKTYFESEVLEIQENTVRIKTPEGERTLSNDFVFAMTGYRPNYPFLNALGLPLSEDEIKQPIFNPETLETPLPRVFVTGVVAAGLDTSKLYIENTRDDSRKIMTRLSEVD